MIQSFTVPGMPVSKARPRTVQTRQGKRMTYTPGKSAAFEKDVKWEAKRAGIRKSSGLVAITMRFYGTRADWDNLAKSICDALNGIAYEDDRQIVEARVFVERKGKPARTEIEISSAGQQELVS